MTTSPETVASDGGTRPVDGAKTGTDTDTDSDTNTDELPEAPTGPRGFEPMSVKGPALIVLGLAVVILLGGVVASAFSSTSSNPTFGLRQVTLPDGTTVALAAGSVKLHTIVSDQQPPSDILGHLGIPQGSVVTGTINSDQNTEQFDRTVDFTSQLSQDQVVSTFTLVLKDLGWQVVYTGAAPQGTQGSTEVLAKRGSSDGFYWETGVVVSPTTPTGTTPYSVEVIQTPDGN
jgi:hypothetical protein